LRRLVLDRWSRGNSPIHRRDARAKIVALLIFLIVVATAHRSLALLGVSLLMLLAAAFELARIPIGGAFLRAALVLPFTSIFAVLSWAAGDPARAASLVLKSYLSALAIVFVVSTTPLPALLHGAERAGAPRFLLLVVQFLYRYLFVISEEARHMRNAAVARGGSAPAWPFKGLRFRAAAGALAVLFARSYRRAEEVHRAMLARGFSGHSRPLETTRFRVDDTIFAVVASLVPIALRLAAERVSG
jgi:cobalt/nickel transport system permease protein